MTFTIRVPSLRSMALVLAGIAMGATFAPVLAKTDRAVATTTYTRASSCHGYDFQPLDNPSSISSGYEGTRRTGAGFYGCHLELPNKAVVTRVRFTLYDKSTSDQVNYCALWRSGLTVATAAASEPVADVPATGEPDAPGIVRVADTSIQNATIDNLNHVYRLQCQILDYNGPKDTGIYGADVTYTISATNG